MSYINIIDKLQEAYKNEPFCNTVTEGTIYDLDLSKKTIFPLVHIIVNSITFEDKSINYGISIIACDVQDITTNKTDNTNYIINTMVNLHSRIFKMLKDGDLYDNGYYVSGQAQVEPFEEKHENKLAGATMTLTVSVFNGMTKC